VACLFYYYYYYYHYYYQDDDDDDHHYYSYPWRGLPRWRRAPVVAHRANIEGMLQFCGLVRTRGAAPVQDMWLSLEVPMTAHGVRMIVHVCTFETQFTLACARSVIRRFYPFTPFQITRVGDVYGQV